MIEEPSIKFARNFGLEIHGKIVLEVLCEMRITELRNLVRLCIKKIEEIEIINSKIGV